MGTDVLQSLVSIVLGHSCTGYVSVQRFCKVFTQNAAGESNGEVRGDMYAAARVGCSAQQSYDAGCADSHLGHGGDSYEQMDELRKDLLLPPLRTMRELESA